MEEDDACLSIDKDRRPVLLDAKFLIIDEAGSANDGI